MHSKHIQSPSAYLDYNNKAPPRLDAAFSPIYPTDVELRIT